MAIKKYSLNVKNSEHARLDHFIAAELGIQLDKPVSRAKSRTLIQAGAVHLNGKRVMIASKPLFVGAKVEIYLDPEKLFGSEGLEKRQKFIFTADRILFEDEVILVVNKPPGLPTQPTLDEARDNFYQALHDFLKGRDGPDAYLGMHHRLDRDTSGVMVFAKSRAANPGLAQAFAGHEIQKTYHALTTSPARSEKWTVKNYLAKETGPGKRSKMRAVRSGGDPALTEFKLVKKADRVCWIEALPKTGRMHQIRVHLSDSGMPILGDSLYGAPQDSVPRVMLHAYSLRFPHPLTRKEILISTPDPEDFVRLWKKLVGNNE